MGRDWKIEDTWSAESSRGIWYECSTSDGYHAAAYYAGSRSVLLSRTIDERLNLGETRRMPYQEAQFLLALHDLSLPPIPEDK